MSDWTLRDAQKFLARHQPDLTVSAARAEVELVAALPSGLDWLLQSLVKGLETEEQEIRILPLIDRGIALVGPDYAGHLSIDTLHRLDQMRAEAEAEDRSKDTDEVAEATKQADGDLHGGDGASGETDTAMKRPKPTHTVKDADGAGGEGDPSDFDADYFGGGQSSAPVVTLADDRVADARWKADPDDISDVKRAMERILRSFEVGVFGEASPRIDEEKLVRELVTKRYRLSHARREELEQSQILIMVDVSGSCSAAAPATLAAAAELADAMDNVLIIVHVNGEPLECAGDVAGIPRIPDGDRGDDLTWWREVLDRASLAGVVNFGDWDADWVLEEVAAAGPLIWLDSYAARHGVKPASKGRREGRTGRYKADKGLGQWDTKPVAYWQGVDDATTAAIALRNIARKGL
jgi:hypothetical protein